MKYRKITTRTDGSFQPENRRYAAHLAEMVSCRTISDGKHYDRAEFERFDRVIEKNYPLIFGKAEKIALSGSTFLRIPGKSSEKPLVLMSHKDIVHEGKKKWKEPPYEGKILGGKMFARGSFDCKGSLCALLEAVESLLAEDFVFPCDLYIFASSNEETGGDDAPKAVEYFKEKGIVPGLVIDEGGAVLKNPFPSPYKRFAMIGTVERSTARFVFDADSEDTAKDFMKEVIRLRPGKYELCEDAALLLKGLSEYLSAPLGNIVGFLARHKKAATFVLTHAGADARSFCGALTGANLPEKGEVEGAVHPVRAFVSGNYYNKIETLAETIRQTAKKYGLNFVSEYSRETEPPVSVDSDGYRFVSDVAVTVFDRIGTLPYPVMGRTDARYFIGYAEDVIRFIPLEISLLQMTKFHCPNENIYVSSLDKAVAFYREAIKQYK